MVFDSTSVIACRDRKLCLFNLFAHPTTTNFSLKLVFPLPTLTSESSTMLVISKSLVHCHIGEVWDNNSSWTTVNDLDSFVVIGGEDGEAVTYYCWTFNMWWVGCLGVSQLAVISVVDNVEHMGGLSRLWDVDSDVMAGIGDDGVLVYLHPDDISGFTSLLLFFLFHSFLFCIQNYCPTFLSPSCSL